jgi:hypothetical protein
VRKVRLACGVEQKVWGEFPLDKMPNSTKDIVEITSNLTRNSLTIKPAVLTIPMTMANCLDMKACIIEWVINGDSVISIQSRFSCPLPPEEVISGWYTDRV